MESKLFLNIQQFFERIDKINEYIYEASMEKMGWADDYILDTITNDLFDFILYLSTDELYIKDINVYEKMFLKNICEIFKLYNIEMQNNEYNFDLFLKINIDAYNSWFKDSEIAREIKLPLSYQERSDTIPISLQQIRCYDQKYNNQNSILYCAYYYDIYNMIGENYLLSSNNINKERKNKLKYFLKHIDDLTFAGLKLSEIINKNNNLPDNNQVSQQEEVTLKNIDEALKELNELIGLKRVKDEVNTVINLIKIKKLRNDKGLSQTPMSLHLVFSGNPGTGKTTVARILGDIYRNIGVLSKGQLIETDRSGLVAGYVGQTAIKTQEIVQKALGGILFIDEAYTLSSNESGNDFGKEAIDTLLKLMEDNRNDLVVIVAGYSEPMEKFLKSNPGIESRFNTFIHFEDYNFAELHKIFASFCKKYNYTVENEAEKLLLQYFQSMEMNKNENFANAREVRNIFENIIKNQANRLANETNISDKMLLEITIEDLFGIIIKR